MRDQTSTIMRGPRYQRILASTALAMILAIPLAAYGFETIRQDPVKHDSNKQDGTRLAVLAERPPAGQTAAPVSSPAPADTAQAPDDDTFAMARTEKAPPDPMASLDPADRVFAEKVRDLLAAKGDKLFPSKRERASVEAFYQNRVFLPLWLDRGVETTRARAAVARLRNAAADGLDPADYKTPSLAASSLATPNPAEPNAEAAAEAELRLTAAVVTYARHLQAGRFPYARVSRNIELPQLPPEPADILTRVLDAADAGTALEEFSPQQEPYRRLKAMLAELRGKPASKETNAQIDTVLANMERWRWYPRDLGKAHVLVNLPEFTLKVMHNGAQVWTTRVVIGKPSMATPLLSETMKHVTINPTWHVPPSIVHNEYLPALAQDPTVLSRMGLRVHYSGGGVSITQPPGEGNALGRIRFNFPNRFLVYQHDTPDKYYFGHEVRAESHGCMRVQDPAKYAEVLFNIARPSENWTAAKVRSLYGSTEQDIQIQPVPIWVHLTYQTGYVDDAGKLQLRRDVYGLDGRTLAAIRSDRGAVDPASERKREEVASRPARRAARVARETGGRDAPQVAPGPARAENAFGYAGQSYGAQGYGPSSYGPPGYGAPIYGRAPRVYR
jgi:murein L,D-transpeptidase YcbB/YkuD